MIYGFLLALILTVPLTFVMNSKATELQERDPSFCAPQGMKKIPRFTELLLDEAASCKAAELLSMPHSKRVAHLYSLGDNSNDDEDFLFEVKTILENELKALLPLLNNLVNIKVRQIGEVKAEIETITEQKEAAILRIWTEETAATPPHEITLRIERVMALYSARLYQRRMILDHLGEELEEHRRPKRKYESTIRRISHKLNPRPRRTWREDAGNRERTYSIFPELRMKDIWAASKEIVQATLLSKDFYF
jgi:hypothetical protein